jgi:hypothetical protein
VRLFTSVLLVTLCSGNFLGAFAQSTTPRSGFAVVTLISGNVAGLIATETLSHRSGSGPNQAIVAPSPLLTSASLLVPVGPITDNTSAIAIANPSTGSGAVNLVLTDTQGGVLFNSIVLLGPFGQFSKFLNEFFPTQPVFFSPALLLTISSEIPVGIVALNFQGDAFTSVPLTSLSTPLPVPQPLTTTSLSTSPTSFSIGGPIAPMTSPTSPPAGFGIGRPSTPMPATTFSVPVTVSGSPVPTTSAVGGIGAFVFPEVVSGGNWSAEIALGNTSDATQVARIDFFDAAGAGIGSLTDILIPPKGVASFEAADAFTVVN